MLESKSHVQTVMIAEFKGLLNYLNACQVTKSSSLKWPLH